MRRILLAMVFIAACTSDATKPATFELSFSVVSGDGQTGPVGAALPQPLVIKATDSRGKAIKNLLVEFRVTSGGGSANPSSVSTNAQGNAQTIWTLGTSPSVSQRLEARAVSTGQVLGSFTATALPGPPAQLTTQAGDAQTAVHDAAVAIAPAVLVRDQYGNVVPGASVTFTVTAGGGAMTGSPAASNAAGIATLGSWTLGHALGANALRATVTGANVVTFSATATTGTAAAVAVQAGNNQTAPVATVVPIAPAVRVTDAGGYPVSGAQVSFAVTTGGGTVTGSPAISGTDGVATLGSWTLGTTAVNNTLTASTPGATAATFSAMATAGPAARMVLYEGDHQTAQVLTPVPIGPAVRVTDAAGNPVPNVRPRFVIVNQWGGGALSDTTPPSDSNGVARVALWTLSSQVRDPQRLRATLSNLADTVFFSATATPSAPYFLLISSGNGQSAVVGTAVYRPPTMVVIDRYNNRVPGTAVTFAVTQGGGSIVGANPATTDSLGYASVGWVLGPEIGPNKLSATVAGIDTATVVNATAITGAPDATWSSVSADWPTITASTPGPGASVSTISVVARNGVFNPVPGATVTFNVSGTGNTIVPATAVTDSLGRATARLTSTVAESKVVTVTIGGVTITQTATVTVKGGYPRSITVVAGEGQTAATGTQLPINPTVLARDEFGNPSPGYNLLFEVYGGGSIGPPPPPPLIRQTDENGLVSLTWVLGPSPGPQLVTTGYGTQIHATAVTPAASIEIVDGNGQTVTAGTNAPVAPRVLVRGSSGEPVANAFVQFTVIQGYGSVTLPPPYHVWESVRTGPDGLASVASWTLGPYNGTNTLEARVLGTDTLVVFTATGAGSAWTRHADLPTYRFMIGTAEVDGRLYAAGGYGLTYGYPFERTTLEVYDPATDTWTERAPMPTARYGPGAAAIDGRIYVVGGIQDVYVLGTLEVYDPATDTWTTKAPMPTPRALLGVAVVDGILYAIGGSACVDTAIPCATNSVATVEAYDPATDTWTTKASMPTPRQSLGTVAVNGRIYAIGGQQTDLPWNYTETPVVGANEEYDPATDSWTTRASLPTARYGPAVASVNGMIHAIGGYAHVSLGTNEQYDPIANTWTVRQSMPTARFWPGVAVLGGKVFVVGGNGAFTTVEAYQP